MPMAYDPTSCTTADDHTRVKLKKDPDVEGSDYINASFIDVILIKIADIEFMYHLTTGLP